MVSSIYCSCSCGAPVLCLPLLTGRRLWWCLHEAGSDPGSCLHTSWCMFPSLGIFAAQVLIIPEQWMLQWSVQIMQWVPSGIGKGSLR